MGIKVKCFERYCDTCKCRTIHTSYSPTFFPDAGWYWYLAIPFLCLIGPISLLLGLLIPRPPEARGPKMIVCEECGHQARKSDLWVAILIGLGVVLIPLIVILARAHTRSPGP